MRVRPRNILLSLLALVGFAAFLVISRIGWEVVLGPKARPVTDRPFERTGARMARGKYLAEGPAACFHCHTEHDLSRPEYPIVQARKGAGWLMPIPELGTLPAPNLTPDPETGLGNWTDDEIARAIREGVGRGNRAIFPVMPYLDLAKLDDEDVASIVVYLRALTPVRNPVPVRALPFPLEYIVKTIPRPITTPQPSHPSATPVERGRYLVAIAGCQGCHTATDQRGVPVPGLEFGGGGLFHDPGKNMQPVFSANITQDPSGIPHYDEALFMQTLRSGKVSTRTLVHIMPFEFFANITDDDLHDIYAFVKSVPAVKHRVSNTDPPTPCPVCNQTHGLGNLNQK